MNLILKKIIFQTALFQLFLFFMFSSGAFAQTKDDKRKTSINFEDELIQGELKKPELFYLLQKKQFNFKRLIKLREDFLPEMRRTSEDLRHSGGGN